MDAKASKEAKESRAALGAGRRGKSSGSGVKKSDGGKSILRDAAKTDFSSEKAAQEWYSNHKEKIARKPGCYILHTLAKGDSGSIASKWKTEDLRQFLRWILGVHHGLLEVADLSRLTPLHHALMEGNAEFVQAVLEHENLINLGNVLPMNCMLGNALHVAIMSENRSVEIIQLLVEKCAQIKDMFVAGRDGDGNRPLHMCMTMDIQADDVDEGSDEGSDLSDDGDGRDTEDGVVISSPAIKRRAPNIVTVEDAADFASPVVSKRSPLGGLQRQTTFVSDALVQRRADMLGVVRLLVDAHRAALMEKNREDRTPYQERIHQLRSMDIYSDMGEDAMQHVITKDPVADFIRSYCIRNLPRDEIIKSLYQPGQERHIEFDLGGLPHANISEDYLDRLSKHLRFESTLKYVALPRLTMESLVRKNRVQAGRKTGGKKGRGLSDLVAVFGWLRKNRVEKIVKVMVIDDGDPSHSDASIVEALRGFEVEVWDWKRVDINTDVIHRCNKHVREVSLYSSGNNAVLMGWASLEGLRSEEYFPDLKHVNLFIREGLEDSDTLGSYIDKFTERMAARPDVKVRPVLDNKPVSFASEFGNSEGLAQADNEWIDTVTTFSSFLRQAFPQFNKSMAVKIAVIDDGVDASLVSLDGKIAVGKSFCPYANSSELIGSYYAPSGNHGTCMASLICKICPEVSLYVARLDERISPASNPGSSSSSRQITAKSAAEAIRWATSCDVDIISMSWTIETPVVGNEDMESFEKAVAAARAKNILMFCSTSDQGSSTKDICYPGDFEGCIKIGGATDTGEPLAWVGADKVDFLLPGKNVPFVNNEGKTVSYESGSSVATAAASGLAGLLLFCGRVLERTGDSSFYLQRMTVSSPGGKPGSEKLRNQTQMRETLKKMCIGGGKRKFPDVQELFERRFDQGLRNKYGAGVSGVAQERSHEIGGSGLMQPLKVKDLLNREWSAQTFGALKWVLEVVT